MLVSIHLDTLALGPIKKIHVKKIYDDDSTVSEAGFCEVRNLGDGEKYLNISDMLG